MHELSELRDLLDKTFLNLNLKKHPVNLYEPIDYTIASGGKRLRPLLVLLGCDLFGGEIHSALPVAVGVEFFHNFTLLHDDIMDRSPVRRGNQTVWKKWNPDIAILSGDTLFALAYHFIGSAGTRHLKKVLGLFTQTAIQVCEGQQYDMDFEDIDSVTIEEYLMMIRLKTAVLLACSLQLGAIVADAPDADASLLYQFGENLGMAFQLRDDLLDCFGNEHFGKEIGGDIRNSKSTFLYLKAIGRSDKEGKKKLIELYRDKNREPSEKTGEIMGIYRALRIKELTEAEISGYMGKALSSLDLIEVNPSDKESLKKLAGELLNREF